MFFDIFPRQVFHMRWAIDCSTDVVVLRNFFVRLMSTRYQELSRGFRVYIRPATSWIASGPADEKHSDNHPRK